MANWNSHLIAPKIIMDIVNLHYMTQPYFYKEDKWNVPQKKAMHFISLMTHDKYQPSQIF